MNFLELFSGLSLWYFYNFNYGIICFILLKSLFNNNYKTALFLFINLFAYLCFGLTYIIFSKFYLLTLVTIFLFDKIGFLTGVEGFKLDELPKITEIKYYYDKIKNYYDKIKNYYSFISIMISLPIYLVLDNLNYLFNCDKYINKIMENNKLKKIKENYNMFSEINRYSDNNFNMSDETNKYSQIDNLDDMTDLNSFFGNILNPDNFLEIANNMRENVGKPKLSYDEVENKIDNFSPLFGMINNSFAELSDMLKELHQ